MANVDAHDDIQIKFRIVEHLKTITTGSYKWQKYGGATIAREGRREEMGGGGEDVELLISAAGRGGLFSVLFAGYSNDDGGTPWKTFT
ncbi:hypothetical protein WN943_005229 [Citrus x changshan-huyou]